MSSEIAGLLTNDVKRHAMRKRAYGGQPIDDVGANGQAPSRELRESTRARPACDRASG